MSLSLLSIILGVLALGGGVYGLVNPEVARKWADGFSRNVVIGYVLTLLATGWFVYNVSLENIADFAPYKKHMMIGFAALGVATCLYVKDFLAVRGLSVLLLLTAKLMVDTARWHDSELRLLVIALAYAWVIAGMWLAISPWRMRDWISWATKEEKRFRILNGIKAGFGGVLVLLGLFVF